VPGELTVAARFRWAAADSLTIIRRNLLIWMRVPAYIVFALIQPVIFVLMFRYVFGGAIPVTVRGGYVDFLLPGILGQTAASATVGTAIALARELKKGVIDRLRSMPMARSGSRRRAYEHEETQWHYVTVSPPALLSARENLIGCLPGGGSGRLWRRPGHGNGFPAS
jgi:hypothetical protein